MNGRYLLCTPGDAPVAIGNGPPRSRTELLRDAAETARRLPAPWPGSEVVVICRDRYCCAVGLLSAWMKGHAVALPASGQREAVSTLAARPESAGVLQDGDGDGWDVRGFLGGSGPADAFTCEASRHLLTMYTSGSTGRPLPCAKTASQILGEATQLARFFQLGPGRRVLPTVPPHHIYGLLFGVLGPLIAGSAFARQIPLHAETIMADARELEVDVLVSAPAHLRGFEALDRGSLPRFARVFSSGASVPPETALMLHERFGMEVTEVLGSSETGGFAFRPAGRSWWQPMPGVEVTAAEDGTLLLRSPFLAPDLRQPLPCPDRVRPLPDGGFEHLGRADGVIKIAGVRVSVLDMENRLLGLPGVRDAAVRAVKRSGPRQQELWAAVVAPEWTTARLRTALSAWFDPMLLPRRMRLLAALPRESTGKLTMERFVSLFQPPERRAPFLLQPMPSPPAEADAPGGVQQERRFSVDIPPDLPFFHGHFPGMPLLPGVVQVEFLVHRAVRDAWPELGAPRGVPVLKFRHPVRPGDRVELVLQRLVDRPAVRFELRGGGGAVCTTGVLVLGAPAP